MATSALVNPCIPHAEVWTPSRSMLTHTLPIPPTDTEYLRRISQTGQRRRETSAMRQMWRCRRGSTQQLDSVLGQYKQMLNAKNAANYTERVEQQPNFLGNPQAHMKEKGMARADGSRISVQSAPVIQRVFTKPVQSLVQQKGNECTTSRLEKPSKHVTSYSQDYVQKIGMTSLPKIPIRTLSADWWKEIQKRPMTRLKYHEPIVVETDDAKIQRELNSKFFTKNSTQTYFQATVPRHLYTYSIHPEFDSEYLKCW